MLIFLGGPGSGKGTQARFLSKFDNFKIFSVGELLRLEISEKTDIGKKIEQTINQGEFASTAIIMDLFKKHVNQERVILDGFPRNLEQANALENFFTENNFFDEKKLLVIDFLVSNELLTNRLMHRKICKICDASLQENESVCSFCGNETNESYKRSDDNDLVIKKRIKKFKDETFVLKEFYKKKKLYEAIDAEADPKLVYNQIRSCIVARNLL